MTYSHRADEHNNYFSAICWTMRLKLPQMLTETKYIFIKISAYHKMTVVHIETVVKGKWKKRMPVSDKEKAEDRT